MGPTLHNGRSQEALSTHRIFVKDSAALARGRCGVPYDDNNKKLYISTWDIIGPKSSTNLIFAKKVK